MPTIDKLAWICVQDRKVLFVRSKNKDLFYTVGGKREGGESDEQALQREVQEEVAVALLPDTISYLTTFKAQAHAQPEGVMVQLKCFTADHQGDLTPSAEIAELIWLASADKDKTTTPGAMVLDWLKEHDLID
ncbi:NUDIX domain-containing protein [Candidatus Kaiserbacteria bacterium]|nr:NUDIX domain-containing protein [Candidatus Kaiserbacteria bacterium]